MLIRELAAKQGGVFRRSNLVAWGFEPTLVLTMRRNGAWVRLHHGVYTDRLTYTEASTPEARHLLLAAAAVCALPAGVALFGSAAALHWGLPVDSHAMHTVHLVRPLGRDSRALRRRISARDHLPAAAVHIIDVHDDELTEHQGLPSVHPDLAAWSTGLVCDVDWAVATMDAVAWRNPSALTSMADFGRRWPRLVGAGRARRAVSLARAGAQSPLESLSRVRLVRAGLPEPTLQAPIYDSSGLIGRADMLFDALGVVGEADGRGKYDTRDDLLREKRREDRIRAEGYGVVRWDWAQARTDMRQVARSIIRASEHSRRRRMASC